jgi:hypothetical protein
MIQPFRRTSQIPHPWIVAHDNAFLGPPHAQAALGAVCKHPTVSQKAELDRDTVDIVRPGPHNRIPRKPTPRHVNRRAYTTIDCARPDPLLSSLRTKGK